MSPIYVNTDTDERFELPRKNPRLDQHPSYELVGDRGDEDDPVRGVLSDPKKAVIPQPAAPSRIDRPGLEADDDPAPAQVDADRDDEDAHGGDGDENAAEDAKAQTARPAAPSAQPGQTQRGGRRGRQQG